MSIEIGLTDEITNTQYAPLAVLCTHYQAKQLLDPLRQVKIPMKTRVFSPGDKLIQVLLSILAGCGPLYEFNARMKPETGIAAIWDLVAFSDQSNLSRTLDALSLKQIEELRLAVTQIWREIGQTPRHNWRGYLWLDYDLSSLPCGRQAEANHRGFASGKKTSLGVN